MEFITIKDSRTGERAFALDFADDIARGVAFLDNEVGPEAWLLKINPKHLELRDATSCVCGQVFAAHYAEGMDRLVKAKFPEGEYVPSWDRDQVSHEHGFSVDTLDSSAEYVLFRDAFVKAAFADGGRTYTASYSDLAYDDRRFYFDQIEAADRWAWSALTEQWIEVCRKLIADRGLALKVSAAWESADA